MTIDAASNAPRRPRLHLGDELRLTLGPFANRGACIAHTDDGLVVFVHFGVPGEEVIAEVLKAKKDHVEARVVEVLRASPERVQPACPYFGACGGCNLQHLPYDKQLEIKHDVVVETLARVGGLRDVPVLPTVPAPSPWFYRNQARFSTNRWGDVGFTRRGTHSVLPIKTCHILQPALGELLPVLQGRGAGLHQIVARCGVGTGDLLVAPDMRERGLTLNASADTLSERVAGETFAIAPSSFFQVNTEQAARMVQLAAERLQLAPTDVLADLYAGGGFFSKIFAPRCARIEAIEISGLAAADARKNLVGLDNVRYQLGATEDLLPALDTRPNKVLLDPSREGCQPAALDAILALRPERIVYISCDVATLARDLARLVAGGALLQEVQPLDMFPQTFHIESIATLTCTV
jgi:23S rRNA (uracil1939-C5)-methyltransferase